MPATNEPEQEGRYSFRKYGDRFWAVYDHETLVCVTVYLKGAREVVQRLSV